jgi:hypothetical protein
VHIGQSCDKAHLGHPIIWPVSQANDLPAGDPKGPDVRLVTELVATYVQKNDIFQNIFLFYFKQNNLRLFFSHNKFILEKYFLTVKRVSESR